MTFPNTIFSVERSVHAHFVAAARASLKDDALQAQLDLKLLPQTYVELKALYGKEPGGEALYKRIQAEASKFIDDALAQIRKLGCFVAGTLVHTREGLKPIEEIKVGDYVLSKPESGEGELCYQPVTRTYEYDDRELYYVGLDTHTYFVTRFGLWVHNNSGESWHTPPRSPRRRKTTPSICGSLPMSVTFRCPANTGFRASHRAPLSGLDLPLAAGCASNGGVSSMRAQASIHEFSAFTHTAGENHAL
jgi:hypothetical protein